MKIFLITALLFIPIGPAFANSTASSSSEQSIIGRKKGMNIVRWYKERRLARSKAQGA